MAGTSGVIEGWADLEQRQVLLKVVLNLPSGSKQTVVHEAWPRNLKLTSEYNASKGTGEALPEASGSKDKKAAAPPPAWALEGREPDCVKVEPSLRNLSADSEKTLQCFLLRCRVGGCLQALMESLPTFSDKDLQFVHRKTERGLWKDELWTKRDFEAQELMLAPCELPAQGHQPHGRSSCCGVPPKAGQGESP